jgi:hypothetical protein
VLLVAEHPFGHHLGHALADEPLPDRPEVPWRRAVGQLPVPHAGDRASGLADVGELCEIQHFVDLGGAAEPVAREFLRNQQEQFGELGLVGLHLDVVLPQAVLDDAGVSIHDQTPPFARTAATVRRPSTAPGGAFRSCRRERSPCRATFGL